MKKNYLLFILLTTCIGFSQTNVTVLEDSFVRGAENADINYNGEIIIVKESSSGNLAFSRHAFLKFDISAYSSITSAVLHVSGNQTSGSTFNVTVSEVAVDTWSESTLIWDNAPASTTVIGTFATPGDINDVYQDFQLNVTSYIQAQLAGDKIVSMKLTDAGSTNETFRFIDKENASTGTPAAYLSIVGATLNIQNQVKFNFAMYPNPTQDSFIIQNSNSEISSVDIFLVNGKTVFNSVNVNSPTLKVNTSAFQTGIYFVKVVDNQGRVSVKKMIKT